MHANANVGNRPSETFVEELVGMDNPIQIADPNAIQINDTLLALSLFAGIGILILIALIQDWYERQSSRRRSR